MGRNVPAKAIMAIAAVAALVVLGSSCRAERADRITLDGYDVRGAAGLDEDVLESVRGQIALVEALPISTGAKAFFRQQTIWIDRRKGQGGHSGKRGVSLKAVVHPADRPILLHELLHMHHFRQLPDGIDNRMVADAFRRARTRGIWPEDSYVMSNKREFYAMTASAVLHGQVARPPNSRDEVAEHLPVYYKWLVKTFELRTGG
jgi:hypothetical protein